MTQPILDLTWIDLTVAVGLVLIAIGVSGWHRTGLARSFAVGAIRTVLQLTLVGYLLVYIFAIDRWYLVVAALLLMLVAASKAAVDRQDSRPAGLFGITGAALLLGSGLTLIYVSVMVVGIVSLPGMMTGQIIAGSDPLVAIRYQIVVMFMLGSAVALAAVVVVLGYRRTFFTPAEQLRPGDA